MAARRGGKKRAGLKETLLSFLRALVDVLLVLWEALVERINGGGAEGAAGGAEAATAAKKKRRKKEATAPAGGAAKAAPPPSDPESSEEEEEEEVKPRVAGYQPDPAFAALTTEGGVGGWATAGAKPAVKKTVSAAQGGVRPRTKGAAAQGPGKGDAVTCARPGCGAQGTVKRFRKCEALMTVACSAGPCTPRC